MEECHKLLTDSVDDPILKHNVNKPLPLGGPPGQVTIQSKFFFNKDLEYLRYGSKGRRPALSISKMKVAYYPDAGLEQMVPDQFWIEEECKYDIAAIQDTYADPQCCTNRSLFHVWGTVVSFSGAKERHEKIELLTTPVVVPFSLAPYIAASAVENDTRNRTAHHSSGGAILAPLFFLSFCDLVGDMCTNGTTFSRANGCPTKCDVVRFLVPLSILLTLHHFLRIFENDTGIPNTLANEKF
uniref:Uncharacterized protein n=1 Tax=Tanacetum cinerariifolium TaxID=118510 RepID=A0A6L2KC17_TANCI|nr:hypothetical protein [Tanacetum cinerariifolium]